MRKVRGEDDEPKSLDQDLELASGTPSNKLGLIKRGGENEIMEPLMNQK
jgi:hypothetical protein